MLQSILAFIAALAVTAALLYLQVKLSGRDKAWLGLIPVTLLLVFTLGVNLIIFSQYGRTETETLTAGLDNGLTARLYVRSAGAEIRAYSPLEIVDEEGALRDCVWLEAETGEADEYVQPYFELFRKMTEGKTFGLKYAVDKALILDESKTIVKLNAGYMVASPVSQLCGPLLYMGVPLMVIYFFKRRQVRRARTSAEMRKMAIENL